ncbi:MAG: ComEC/Rec2 family competence protein [Bacteroidia bacterium]
MAFFRRVPILKAFLPYLAGLLSAVYLELFTFPLAFAGAITFAVAGLLFHLVTLPTGMVWLKGIPLQGFMFFLGGLMILFNTAPLRPGFYGHHLNEKYSLALVSLDEPLARGAKTYKAKANVLALLGKEDLKPVKGKVQLYLKVSDTAGLPAYGEVLAVKPYFREIPPPMNPGEFNYQQYMYFNQVYYRSFLKESDWRLTGLPNQKNALMQQVVSIRETLLSYLRKHISGQDEFAVASALLLGVKDEISNEVRQMYAATGAMHVLAVSGLHVGIIYVFFQGLLGFFKKVRYGNYLRFAILIVILWSYALLTGLSPSVMRAATMFTFVAFGQNLKRYTSIYNSIFTSALLLLLINPFLIMQVGFQLSYAAVLGIVLIQPKLYALIPFPEKDKSIPVININWKLWLPEKVWAITTVSIAAQIGTFPLALLYFNQFPVYFLLSNLVVIPAAFFVLSTGFPMLFFEAVNFAPLLWLSSLLLNGILSGLNSFIAWANYLPGALLSQLYLSIADTFLVYFIIAFCAAAFFLRSSRYVLATCFFAIIFLAKETVAKWEGVQQQEVVVHNIGGSTAFNFIQQGEGWFVADSALLAEESKQQFHIMRHLWSNGIRGSNWRKQCLHESPLNYGQLCIEFPFIQFGEISFLIANENQQTPVNKVRVDYLLIKGDGPKDFSGFLKKVDCRQILIDGSSSYYAREKWMAKLEEMNRPYRNLAEEGALVLQAQAN